MKLDVELMNEINKRIPFLSKRLENQKRKILNNAERYIYEMQEIDQLKKQMVSQVTFIKMLLQHSNIYFKMNENPRIKNFNIYKIPVGWKD